MVTLEERGLMKQRKKVMQIRKHTEGLRASPRVGLERLTDGKKKMQDRNRVRGWGEAMEQLKEGMQSLCSLPSSVSGNVRVCWRWNGNGCCGQA